jgi:hypothetical protein
MLPAILCPQLVSHPTIPIFQSHPTIANCYPRKLQLPPVQFIVVISDEVHSHRLQANVWYTPNHCLGQPDLACSTKGSCICAFGPKCGVSKCDIVRDRRVEKATNCTNKIIFIRLRLERYLLCEGLLPL